MIAREIFREPTDQWFIAYNTGLVIEVHGKVDAGLVMNTHRDIFHQFDNEAEWLEKLTELGIEL